MYHFQTTSESICIFMSIDVQNHYYYSSSPSIGTSLIHSPMLDLDSDVRPSPIGHLSQTASLKRGSSFQSGRDDGRHLFCLETQICNSLYPVCCTVRKTNRNLDSVCLLFWFVGRQQISPVTIINIMCCYRLS